MAAIKTQPGNQVESLQLACPVCSSVRMWNVDHTEIWQTETRSILHVMPATHPQNSLVPSCNQCWSDQSDGALRAGGSHQSHFVDGVRWSLDTSADYLRRRQVGWLCDWQSTREVEAVPTTTHIGSDDQDDRDTPGSDKWRSTPVPPLMLRGTLPSTAAVWGRYDPSWSSVINDDDDDWSLAATTSS